MEKCVCDNTFCLTNKNTKYKLRENIQIPPPPQKKKQKKNNNYIMPSARGLFCRLIFGVKIGSCVQTCGSKKIEPFTRIFVCDTK